MKKHNTKLCLGLLKKLLLDQEAFAQLRVLADH